MTNPVAQFPEALKILFRAMRYKVARGGRGSGKSWGFARALLILGARYKLRILCAREVQESIKQSVHKLLKDQIKVLGLSSRYQVLATEIRGINGTEFAFCGLSGLTVDSVKSYEGYDICWVEEAQTISSNSWEILIPTIRKGDDDAVPTLTIDDIKDNSEIWISFNPDMETDPTYEKFITNPPDDILSVIMNWRDNPWFNEIMNKERLHCKATTPDDYENIWEGKCRPAVKGAIYFKEVKAAQDEGRICNIPYDPMLKVHVVLDLGWGDSLTASLVQKHLSEIRIIKYLEWHQTRLDVMSAELRNLNLNWGLMWLPPSDGFNRTLTANGKSAYDIMKNLGWDLAVRHTKKRTDIEVVELGIEDGIRNVRLKFSQIYFDKKWAAAKPNPLPPEGQTVLTNRLLECLKRYRRKVNKETGVAGSPVHDEHTHGGDNLRYICANADKMTNEETKPKPKVYYPGYRVSDEVVGY
jgi:phage terminase large subunit